MKFNVRCFLSAFVLLLVCHNTNAASDCSSGKFLFTSKCYACPPGCYCKGTPEKKSRLDPKDTISQAQLNQWCNRSLEDCSSGDSDYNGSAAGGEWKQCGRSSTAGVFRCPTKFPYSEGGQKLEEQCYATTNSGMRLYYKTKSCDPGYYLPMNSDECAPCPINNSDYCPGITKTYPSTTENQGISQCPDGVLPTNNRTACEKDTRVNCSAGTYLPANSNFCSPCPDGKLCRGGNFTPNVIDQGDDDECGDNEIIGPKRDRCIECPDGKTPNDDKTECVNKPISVAPGYYLPRNKTEPTSCKGKDARKFCPGGEFTAASIDQGIYDCPNNSRANDNNTACKITLTKEQMKYGFNGQVSDTPCYVKTDYEDYLNCIYGVRFTTSDETNQDK